MKKKQVIESSGVEKKASAERFQQQASLIATLQTEMSALQTEMNSFKNTFSDLNQRHTEHTHAYGQGNRRYLEKHSRTFPPNK